MFYALGSSPDYYIIHLYKNRLCVGMRWILGNEGYIRLRKNVNKAEPTLALKPRADVTRKSKTGEPVAPQKGHVCPPKT